MKHSRYNYITPEKDGFFLLFNTAKETLVELDVRCEQGYHAVLSEEPCYVWSGPVRLCRRGFTGRCCTAAGIRAAKAAETEIHQPKAGTAACALHLRPLQPAHQEGQAEGRFYHAGGRVCSHP